MQKYARVLLLPFAFCFASVLFAQIKQTSIPIGDAADKALKTSLLTGEDAQPFHIRISISEPENPQSPYQGTIEEWWLSSNTWRREVTDKDGMKQTIVVSDGKKSEKDEGDYFPLWLRNFVSAAFDPLPNAAAWKSSGATINQITLPNGAKSTACARLKTKIGTGDRATDAFWNVCLDGEGRFDGIFTPRFGMEFHDYKKFGRKQVAHTLVHDPEPGTKLVGRITELEEAKHLDNALFTPLATNDERFRSIEVPTAKLEEWTAINPPVDWPPVHSGNTRGQLAMYISIDNQGQVREAWPLNSDNAGLEDPGREQVRKWKINPPKDPDGNPLQVDGGLGFNFATAIGVPLPELTDAEARQHAVKIVEPVFPPGSVKPGTRYRFCIGVNEQGKFAGGGPCHGNAPGAEFPSTAAMLAAFAALEKWEFKPLIKDGNPWYFHAEIIFTGK